MSPTRTIPPSPEARDAERPDAAIETSPVPAPVGEAPPAARELLRIQEVSAEVGLTPRSIRYYEELGLLTPAARSGGDYRLYDESDVERLRFIKGLRDDAGFSLAEIRQLLEDEAARRQARERMRSSDPAERREAVLDTIARVERQIDTLRSKAARIDAMSSDAERRLAHLRDHLAELDGAGQGPTG
ncbi:MAG TPA: MerR family transcriptional regulator [Candidatus Dormibacteraeota bacterium]|nr:MerR family transcriptional regulator [Candidatus Dormibacteraeota bacterium]